MTTCAVDGCDRKARSRGWCMMHWKRWRRHGDPTYLVPRPTPSSCAIEGCDAQAHCRGWCEKHYTRWLRHGDATTVHKYEGRSRHSEGYLLVKINGHVLANSSGYVAEHRLVLWDKLGGADARCYWCGMTVRWSRRWPLHRDALVVDHLDGDGFNNDPSNLVPSCNPCNSTRVPNSGRFKKRSPLPVPTDVSSR